MKISGASDSEDVPFDDSLLSSPIKSPVRNLFACFGCNTKEGLCDEYVPDNNGQSEETTLVSNNVIMKRRLFCEITNTKESNGKMKRKKASSLFHHMNVSKNIVLHESHDKKRIEQTTPIEKRRSPTLYDYFKPEASVKGNEENLAMHNYCPNENGEIYRLPFIETGKDALKRISSTTLIDIINGKYDDLYDEKFVIDCRFEYEFNGGHIQSAININSMERLEETLLKNPMTDKRVILIFHCEFSSHRAPRMALYLRKKDRIENLHVYPKLYYPEIYILKGGYKDFYLDFRNNCIPQNYVQMNDISYEEDFRKEVSVSEKSWRKYRKSSKRLLR